MYRGRRLGPEPGTEKRAGTGTPYQRGFGSLPCTKERRLGPGPSTEMVCIVRSNASWVMTKWDPPMNRMQTDGAKTLPSHNFIGRR